MLGVKVLKRKKPLYLVNSSCVLYGDNVTEHSGIRKRM